MYLLFPSVFSALFFGEFVDELKKKKKTFSPFSSNFFLFCFRLLLEIKSKNLSSLYSSEQFKLFFELIWLVIDQFLCTNLAVKSFSFDDMSGAHFIFEA